MDDAVYHVVLDGQMVGPYDRRTIVGMRIKKTLTSDHVVVTSDGVRFTVGDLVRNRNSQPPFQADRSGTYSLVQATYVASLLEVDGRGFEIPDFKGEVEARVQSEVLRLAGRFRQGLGWKEDRIKLPLTAIAHARVRGSLVDLWLRRSESGFQTVCLELFTPESAGEFVDWLPNATPWPGSAVAAAAEAAAKGKPDAKPAGKRAKGSNAHPLLWGAVVGTILAVTAVLLWVLVFH